MSHTTRYSASNRDALIKRFKEYDRSRPFGRVYVTEALALCRAADVARRKGCTAGAAEYKRIMARVGEPVEVLFR